MEYSNLQFNNIQLIKLVSSAEIILQHLYDLVSLENKVFIDQWFCFKQEFDETCSSSSQVDINENVQECPVLARIDEVSENEKVSTVSSISKSSFDSDTFDRPQEESSNNILNEASENINIVNRIDNKDVTQLDFDLLDYMTDFKLFTDNCASDWFKTLSFNSSEIKQYTKWMESHEYQKIWNNIYSNDGIKNLEMNEIDESKKQFLDENKFIPIGNDGEESINSLESNKFEERFQTNYNPIDHLSVQPNIIDQHIRYLQEIRQILFLHRQKLDYKLKNNDDWKTKSYVEYSLKIDVAFEILDTSIQMKNQMKLGHNIENLRIYNEEVDPIIANCLHTLSLNETRHLLYLFLNSVTEMRKCSSDHDNQVRELDREVSNLKYLIWKLYQSYKSRCDISHKDIEQKLQLMDKLTDESLDESLIANRGRELLPILEKSSLQGSTHSDSRDLHALVSCMPLIPEKNLKTLQNTSAPIASTKVERSKGKMKLKQHKPTAFIPHQPSIPKIEST